MKKEQQRIKIAEACGWSDFNSAKHEGAIQYGRKPLSSFNSWEVPDYLNDLNAMYEAKQSLWKMDWSYRHIFNDHLANIIKGRIVNRNEWDAETLLDATAEQQAEAFLRTLNLWEE
jgi:hypothetical protein